DYANESGLYVGSWASTVDFGPGTAASYELDLYAGFAGEAAGLGYDVGYIFYAYPDEQTNIDFGEIYGELSYSLFAAGVAYTVNSENQDALFDTGDIYYYLSAGVPLANDFSLSLTAPEIICL
ncbi:MAG: TorF family putative porin, partial [Candidatus Micropelagos thuwalensis]